MSPEENMEIMIRELLHWNSFRTVFKNTLIKSNLDSLIAK